MNIGGGNGLRPCEVRITANRKRVAAATGGQSYNRQPEPLPVQIKRKNCPYMYRRDDQEGDNVVNFDNPLDNESAVPPQVEQNGIPNNDQPVERLHIGEPNTMLAEMARLYPDLSVANLQTLIKSAESARNQTSSSNRQNEEQTIKCSHIPIDWSLKTSLGLNLPVTNEDEEFMVQVRKCSDSDAMAKAVTSFIDTYSTLSKMPSHDRHLTSVLSAVRAASKMWCLSSISLLNNGAISRHARSSLESSRPTGSDQAAFFDNFVKELNAKWLTGLLSIFNLTKLQLCPYFYVMDDRITALIACGADDAPGESGQGSPFSKLVASIAPAPPGLISWLRNSKINFSSINEHGVEIQSPKADGAVVQDSEEALDDDVDNVMIGDDQNSRTGGQDEADSLSYFEELGVASMILENFKADGKAAEKKKQPLIRAVVIRGRAVLSFVNLLVESRGFPDRSKPSAAEVKRAASKSDVSNSNSHFPLPALMAPVAFDCACLSSFRIRISVNNNTSGQSIVVAAAPSNGAINNQTSLSIQLTGALPLPPFVLHRVFACLVASGRAFSTQAETWLAKSQGDHLNSSLASIVIASDNNFSNSVIDKTATPKTFSAASFTSGFFSLPVSK